MNESLISILKSKINSKGIKYSFISKETRINYQRLMRIFNQNAIISAIELLTICRVLNINPLELEVEKFNQVI